MVTAKVNMHTAVIVDVVVNEKALNNVVVRRGVGDDAQERHGQC